MTVKTIKGENMFLLPPPKDFCQECAIKHEPFMPHNKDSLYYQTKFRMQHGRSATWGDAMAHCSEEIQKLWRDELQAMGIA